MTRIRDHSGYGISQWEKALHSNAFSHCPSPYPEWSPRTRTHVGIVNKPYETIIDYISLETKMMWHSQTRGILLSISRNRFIDVIVAVVKLNLVKSLFIKRKRKIDTTTATCVDLGRHPTKYQRSSRFVVSCMCCGQQAGKVNKYMVEIDNRWCQYTGAVTKWSPVCRRHFQMHFHQWKL